MRTIDRLTTTLLLLTLLASIVAGPSCVLCVDPDGTTHVEFGGGDCGGEPHGKGCESETPVGASTDDCGACVDRSFPAPTASAKAIRSSSAQFIEFASPATDEFTLRDAATPSNATRKPLDSPSRDSGSSGRQGFVNLVLNC